MEVEIVAKALDKPPGRMTVDQFIAWLEDGPEGARYELVAGEVVAMAPERAATRVARLGSGVPSTIKSPVKIDEHTAYEPDALVHCDQLLPDDDAIIVPAPVIVVEVLSPTTKAHDAGVKLADYFRLPSVRHYLLVRTERATVIHHRRDDKGDIATRIVTAGALELDPPGLTLDLDRIYG